MEAFDRQILMTYRGQNMKSMKMSLVRYQIIGFLVFLFHFGNPFGRYIQNVVKLITIQV